MRRLALVSVFILSLLLVACDSIQPTGDRASDAESAQNQLPSFANYIQTDAANVKETLTRVLQAGSIGSGNFIAAGLLERLNGMADCLGNVGALAGRVYTSPSPVALGLLVVINTERLTSNFMQCAINPSAQSQRDGAQAIEPCARAGSYSDNGVSYSYMYAASDPSMCASFDGWLNTKQP